MGNAFLNEGSRERSNREIRTGALCRWWRSDDLSTLCGVGRVAEKQATRAGRGVHICHTYTKHTQRNAGLLAGQKNLRSAAGYLPKGIRTIPESDKLAWTVSLAKRIKHWLNMRAGAKVTGLSKPADRETGHQA